MSAARLAQIAVGLGLFGLGGLTAATLPAAIEVTAWAPPAMRTIALVSLAGAAVCALILGAALVALAIHRKG